MEITDKDIRYFVVKKQLELYEKKLSTLEDIKTYGGYKVVFTKSNRGTAHPAEVEIIANTAHIDMDVAEDVIAHAIKAYQLRIRMLRLELKAEEDVIKK